MDALGLYTESMTVLGKPPTQSISFNISVNGNGAYTDQTYTASTHAVIVIFGFKNTNTDINVICDPPTPMFTALSTTDVSMYAIGVNSKRSELPLTNMSYRLNRTRIQCRGDYYSSMYGVIHLWR